MYINNLNYNNTSTLHTGLIVKRILIENFYGRREYIDSLCESITKFIDCISIDFDEIKYEFIIKIKKTAMRSRKNNFINNSNYYYTAIMINIFRDFLLNHKVEFLSIVKRDYPDLIIYDDIDGYENLFNQFIDTFSLNNLANITCYFDNIVSIKL